MSLSCCVSVLSELAVLIIYVPQNEVNKVLSPKVYNFSCNLSLLCSHRISRLRSFQELASSRSTACMPPPPPPLACCAASLCCHHCAPLQLQTRSRPHAHWRCSFTQSREPRVEIYLSSSGGSCFWGIQVGDRVVYSMMPNPLDENYAVCPNV